MITTSREGRVRFSLTDDISLFELGGLQWCLLTGFLVVCVELAL